KAFRLLGLKWAGADSGEIEKATRDLLEDQRDDGGWSQLPGKGSDAYATGQVLIALHDGGGVPASHGAFSRGTVYLIITQQQDGSWRVPKRTPAAQQYFETSFPHGKDQFISVPGTAWATAALALSVPKQAPLTAKR
ncbi:MAG: Ankyrin repeat-like protein, partial [Armatimonadetes bacterium]|nr:Ankyrin repeat-like protein [Armatimonadota bacterium]